MENKLDLKDRKILFELEQDSRQSLQQLAKKVGLKKETVFHRLRNLEKEGIVKAYLTMIDIYKLGYGFYPVLIRFQNTTPAIEQKILDYIKDSPYTAWLTKCEGAWDINFTLVAKGNFELKGFLDKFLEKYSQYVSEKQIFITTALHYFKRGFWLGKETTETISTGGASQIEISEQDIRLLKILSKGARKSLVEIGKELNTSPNNIAYKIKKLEKDKIIQGSWILVDFLRIGYKFYKIWFSLKDINKENFELLKKYFQKQPNIIWMTEVIGCYDLSIEMEVKDLEEFQKVMDDIKLKFSHLIKKHESLMIFEEKVLDYLPQVK